MGSFTATTHGGGVPVLYTLSQPYGARDWWPCRQGLFDKIDSVMLVVTTPAGYRAAANGMLLREQHCDDRSTYIWMHRHPVAAYLVAVAVTNYAVYSDYVPVPGQPSIEILNYVYPEDEENARSQTRQIIRPFQIFNELFGLYPFANERYGHAQWNYGGGMEHQTMSFMGSWGYDLLAHELAHQWFGDYVTCGSWQDVWLNEGFATYLTGLCYERDLDTIYWEPFKRLTINRVMREPGGSVFCYDTTDFRRIFNARLSYSKGAIVLHMLRWEMGDEAFFRGVNNYLYDPALANGYARTPDLLRHLEAAADTSFTEFFSDWVYGEGYPTYSIGYRPIGDNILEITISQDQSHPSVSFFEMHLPIRLIGQERDTLVVVHHTIQDQVFTLNPGFTVASVELDPDRWICTANAIITGLPPIRPDHGITVYPNPFEDKLYVHIPNPAGPVSFTLHDLQGKVIKEGTQMDTNEFTDYSNLKSGTYILTVRIGQETFSFPLVKK
jgi:aminopeptidase N